MTGVDFSYLFCLMFKYCKASGVLTSLVWHHDNGIGLITLLPTSLETLDAIDGDLPVITSNDKTGIKIFIHKSADS